MPFFPSLQLRRSLSFQTLVLAFLLAAATLHAAAQERGPGGPPGGPGGSRNPLGGMPPPGGGRPGGPNSGEPGMRPSAQLGPPSRWWDDGPTAKSVGLNSQQQRRMDDVFSANKPTLLKLYTNLKTEEAKLAKATSARTVSETEVDQQIDKVTAARGELGKAYAHMQLQIRKELTPEQAARLDQHSGS